MPRTKQGVASALDLTNHEKEDWTKAHRIWENVRPLMPGGISAQVYLSADWTLSYNAWAVVPFNTVIADAGNIYDETTDHDFTISTAGLYMITGHIEIHQGAAAARNVRIGIYKGATLVGQWGSFSSSIETTLGFSGALLVSLAIGDVITIKAYQGGAGTAVHAHGGLGISYCGIVLVGPA